MSKINITSQEWCDLVFEGKNKEYGAYDLRRNSNNRHNKALIIVLILAVLAFTMPSLLKIVLPEKKDAMVDVTAFVDLKPAEEKTEEVKPIDTPPPPPLKSSIKFTPPVITKGPVAEEEEMKTQDEIKDSKVAVSIADIQGTDEEKGQLIEDVKDVTQTKDVEEKPYTFVEQMPQFPGGDKELFSYLNKNIKYPVVAQENQIQGKVLVRFVVNKNGEITNVEVIKSLDASCDKEAVRVVKSMPNWMPGKQNGNSVNVYYILPVLFKLSL